VSSCADLYVCCWLTNSFTRQITLTIANPAAEDQDLLSLDVYPDMTVETLRSSIQAETRIPPTSQHIYHNGQLVQDDSKTLEQLQIGDGEMLALHVRQVRSAPGGASAAAAAAGRPQQPQQSAGQGRRANPAADPETLRLQLLGDPNARAQMQESFPQLAAALNDPQRFANLIRQVQDSEQRERDERQRRIAALNADPFDPEAQAQIEEMIRGERVQENLQSAMEHNPEGMFCQPPSPFSC
jgi:DNA damage-inducible protein 1